MAGEHATAAALMPDDDAPLSELARIAADCTACDLHRTGTQTVFGEGAPDATVVLVGEQPGDAEDVQGHPFVGPAGRELDRALESAGLAAASLYRTNVVKHFKWRERRGKRRIHAKPNRIEIEACLPWLHGELQRTDPVVLVTLGATATQALLGGELRITRARGRPHVGPRRLLTIPTVHPSSVLRAPGDRARRTARGQFVDDLTTTATVVRSGPETLLESLTKPQLGVLATGLDVAGWRSLRKASLVAAVSRELERAREDGRPRTGRP